MRYENAARKILDVLLENEPPVVPPQPQGQPTNFGRRPVRVKTPAGEVQGEWNGYYDMRLVNRGTQHNIGYPGSDGKLTHGPLRKGDELLDQVPTFDEWSAEQQRVKAQPPL